MKQTITDKDQEILNHLAEGFTVKQIAPKVFLSPTTVAYHVQELKRKLKAKNTNELISLGYKKGYLKILVNLE